MERRKIQSALISVFYKDQLEPILQVLKDNNVTIYSTGGTQKFIQEQGIDVIAVESLTGYPSILGGRVKTLHPKVFGGILSRRDNTSDQKEVKEYEIPDLDLVIVDLYPFEETVASGADEQSIIEKIDIGGISLIRAAAKNYKDVTIVASKDQYGELLEVLKEKDRPFRASPNILLRKSKPSPEPPKSFIKSSKVVRVKGLPKISPAAPTVPNWSYCLLLSGSPRTLKASLISLNFSLAHCSLPGLRSGWYCMASLR